MEPFLTLSPNARSYAPCSCNTTRSPKFSRRRSGISLVWKSSTSRKTISSTRSPANFLSASTTLIFHRTPSPAWFRGVSQTWLSFNSSTSHTTSSPVRFRWALENFNSFSTSKFSDFLLFIFSFLWSFNGF